VGYLEDRMLAAQALELARFVEAACARARPSARDAATGSEPHVHACARSGSRRRPLAAGAGELPAVS
jgi:hypothetical protein